LLKFNAYGTNDPHAYQLLKPDEAIVPRLVSFVFRSLRGRFGPRVGRGLFSNVVVCPRTNRQTNKQKECGYATFFLFVTFVYFQRIRRQPAEMIMISSNNASLTLQQSRVLVVMHWAMRIADFNANYMPSLN
jgi:hypothetical protein